MGIPHLISSLQPYTTHENLNGWTVVIDGNALAYHIYHLCVVRRYASRNTLESLPQNLEIAETVIEWLEWSVFEESLHSNSGKIYFDGFLPPLKMKTRSLRLGRLTNQYSNYYKTHNALRHTQLKELGQMTLFGASMGAAKPCLCPPPPYLVPVVLETLYHSKNYSNLIEVVPWEADFYCAQYAKENGVLVLSGDSDLLIYDLGPQGAVAFFKDIKQSIPSKELSAAIYKPTEIVERLGLDKSHGLKPFAFELLMASTLKFSDIKKRAISLRALEIHPIKYRETFNEYNISFPKYDSKSKLSNSKSLAYLQALDPRISEYVLQFPTFAKVAKQPCINNFTEKHVYRIFLPFLLDSPARTSGWEIASVTRQLAYGLVNLALPAEERIASVVEHRRQHAKFGGRELGLPTTLEISTACSEICSNFSKFRDKFKHFCNRQVWIVMTILQEIEWSQLNNKLPMTLLAAKHVAKFFSTSMRERAYHWDLIHFLAQIDASFYSYRILQQISRTIIAQGHQDNLPAALFNLSKLLESLPKICEFPDRDLIISFLHDNLSIISSMADN
ncbi:hypothetical protein BGHDH14_bgh05230 [Blumeria hordei DH14]|uniref:Asteroid domain-containing protein n=2 Tax=Blumeria hordei TaxID=2867405 RepID=N1JIC3_BLUG1|nr:hypothetical protein BGHDH14_bgh05230 [Blumeria hordei DH14]